MLRLVINCFRKQKVKIRLPNYPPLTKSASNSYSTKPTQPSQTTENTQSTQNTQPIQPTEPVLSAKKELYHLKEYEWNALTRYYLFDYICHHQHSQELKRFKSIRQLILQRERFSKFILDKIHQQTGIKHASLEEIGFDTNILDKIVRAFDVSQGIHLPAAIFTPGRFEEAKYYTPKTILNPQIHSIQILKKLAECQQQGIIYGTKGIGKSFTYALYAYLTNSLISCRIKRHLDKRLSNELFQLIPQQQFNQFPFLIYFPLQILFQERLSIAKQCLLQQCPAHMKIDKFQNENIKTISQFLSFTKRYFQAINKYFQPIKGISKSFNEKTEKYLLLPINFAVVIDEANYYFSQVRFLDQNIIKHKQKNKYNLSFKSFDPSDCQNQQIRQSFKKVDSCSKFLQQVGNASRIIFNSSQKLQEEIIISFNSKYQKKLFDIKQHQRGDSGDLKIDYTRFLLTDEGVRQLYTVFWFQIEKILQIEIKFDEMKKTQKIRELKNIFLKTFSLRDQNYKPKKWYIDIKQLQIRKKLQESSSRSLWITKFRQMKTIEENNMLTPEQKKQELQLLFTSFFLSMKIQIQSAREAVLANTFQRYIWKSQPGTNRALRYEILLTIELNLMKKIKADNQNKTIYQEVQLRISYQQLYQKYGKTTQMKKIIDFPSKAGIGTIDRQKKQYIFLISKRAMSKMLSFLALYNEQLGSYFKIITCIRSHPALVRHILDKIYFFLFMKNAFIYSFKAKKKLSDGVMVEQVETYQIIKTRALEPVQKFKQQFKISILNKIIGDAKDNPGKTILGYNELVLPMIIPTENPSYFYRSQNAFYDYVLVTYDEENAKTKIKLVDSTISQNLFNRFPNTDILKQKLRQYTTSQRVSLEFCILTHYYNLVRYEQKAQKQAQKQTKNNIKIPYLAEQLLSTNSKKSVGFYIITFDEHRTYQHIQLYQNKKDKDLITQSLFQTIKSLKLHQKKMDSLKIQNQRIKSQQAPIGGK